MGNIVGLARMTTPTQGTGTITLGAAVQSFLSFAAAGINDGEIVSYGIIDGTNREEGEGTYTAAGTTLTRTVIKSTNANGPISLSGTAQVFVSPTEMDFLWFDAEQNLTEAKRAQAQSNLKVGGFYLSYGLVGANNSIAPNSKMDFSADIVVVRNAGGATRWINNAGTITNDTGLAGPAANGRDQAGAFSNSIWVHYYWVWNGATLATVSSASAPPTGPTLPGGYTHWGYLGSVYKDGSGNLRRVRFTGSRVFYSTDQSCLVTGTATVETSVSVSTLVPPNAPAFTVSAFLSVSAGSASDGPGTAIVRVFPSCNLHTMQAWQTHSVLTGYDTAYLTMPNVSQNLYYLVNNNGNDGAPTLSLNVTGYSVPNGGD